MFISKLQFQKWVPWIYPASGKEAVTTLFRARDLRSRPVTTIEIGRNGGNQDDIVQAM
jgi:hypothetical protein